MSASTSPDPSGPIPLFPDRPRPVRQRIGRYELIAEIAHGGMGTVYLARHGGEGGFQRLCALKLMHPHLTEDVDFVGMFLDEARIAARMHHQNVVGIHDLGSGERGHYVVMEYVEGCTLSQLLKRNPRRRPPRLLVPIILDLLEGLHAAHTLLGDDGEPLGLIHRDVSPANILVGADGNARLTDFGIAKARARITSTRPGVHKGKLAYTAPEQLGGPGEVDARVDLFAAGAVMWSALTGKALFLGATEADTLRKLLDHRVQPPSEVGLRPPEVLDEVCLRALARDPSERYGSAREMADDLRRAATSADLLGAPSEVAALVDQTFGAELAARRRVARAASEHTPSSLPELPRLSGGTGTAHGTTQTPPSWWREPEPAPPPEPEVVIESRPGAVSRMSRRRPLITGAVLSAAALLGVLAWVIVGRDGGQTPPPSSPAASGAAAGALDVESRGERSEPAPAASPIAPANAAKPDAAVAADAEDDRAEPSAERRRRIEREEEARRRRARQRAARRRAAERRAAERRAAERRKEAAAEAKADKRAASQSETPDAETAPDQEDDAESSDPELERNPYMRRR